MASDGEKTVKDGNVGDLATSQRTPLASRKVLVDSLVRLNPVSLASNPVMMLVEIMFFIVAAMAIYPSGFVPVASPSERVFYIEIWGYFFLLSGSAHYLTPSQSNRQRKRQAAYES